MRRLAIFFGLWAAALPAAALADEHIYSYEPGSAATRTLTATGLSFQFEKRPLGGVSIKRIIQTGERGSADLRAGSERDLGPGGLPAALAGERALGKLYEITPEGDGKAFVGAVCPGAERAWLVIGPLERFKDLDVQVVGRDAGAAAARHCVTLTFSFRNDWQLPQRTPTRPRPVRNLPG